MNRDIVSQVYRRQSWIQRRNTPSAEWVPRAQGVRRLTLQQVQEFQAICQRLGRDHVENKS
jgi:hypothetical protein